MLLTRELARMSLVWPAGWGTAPPRREHLGVAAQRAQPRAPRGPPRPPAPTPALSGCCGALPAQVGSRAAWQRPWGGVGGDV